MSPSQPPPVVVLGAGPAGLASAACLKRRGVEALLLEAGPSVGTSWHRHYRRLHLHTVKGQSALPGLPFGPEVPRYPSREQVVAYLEAYAAHFGLAARTGEVARRVRREGDGFAVETSAGRHPARAVVVALGLNRVPNPERLPGQEAFAGTLLHAGEYRDGERFRGQRVLVVGAGNTGAELALDLVEHGARPTLSVRSPLNVVPRDFLGTPTQLTSLLLAHLPLAVADGVARAVSRVAFGDLSRLGLGRPERGPLADLAFRGRIPLLDIGTVAAIRRGAIAVKPGVARLTREGADFADGTSAPFEAVVLATGYRPGLEALLDAPGALDERGFPRDWRGGGACPGLYFVGYANVATGLLRELGLHAEAMAAEVSARLAG